ncbi:hypothetical protein HHK36_011514 [Tetracentron sinense]|uniref:ABC transporter domain-containing protein n=1 Tax=Tetracentron sinense TaxID=13715 RepID=A0A835DHC8_TETSI|nr:hypothetical protein HHK36_011514 [Tetracentron sinense]
MPAVEDIEAGKTRMPVHTEPTLPIYLKVSIVALHCLSSFSLLPSISKPARHIRMRLMGPIEHGYCDVVKRLDSGRREDNSREGYRITGSALPGEVLALMGPSGSGKTTLLNLLGGRLSGPVIGVRETLTYTALLRLPKTLTKQQKEEQAMAVICELGLERCQDTMIGGSFVRGVSGGERKRVCIGNEIIINPSILFLDERTSGLDSTTALRIVQMLRDIAEAGKTVITTIHQPSSRLFHKFEKLILLGKGSLLYFGKALEAMVYFSSIGCSPLIAMNPAEFLLDLANGNINDVSVPSELEDKVQMENLETETRNGKPSPAIVHEYLVEAYETRVADKEKKKLLAQIPMDEELKSKVSSLKREWGASWWEQYSILFWRGLKERRHDYLSWSRVTQVLSTAIILGLLWWHSDGTTPKGMQDQAGLLFFIAVFWSFFPVYTAIFTFPQEEPCSARNEHSAKTRVQFQGFGLVIGAIMMDVKRAMTLASVTVMTFMLAGGFFVKKVLVFISWIRCLSFNYHTYRLLLKVQYEHITTSINGMKLDSGLKEVCAMVAMAFGYRLLAYLSLRKMKLQSGS